MCTQDGLASDQPIGGTEDNLRAAIASELHEYTNLYSGMARTARDEGLDDIAELFETLARTGRSHTGPLQRALDTLVPPGVPTGVPAGAPSGSVGFVE
jgi:rubrerythrin